MLSQISRTVSSFQLAKRSFRTSEVTYERRTGRVKWFNEEKGFGFIIDAETQQDVFVHYREIQSDKTFRSLREDDLVEFEINETTKGNQAVQVVQVEGENEELDD
eukprot:TRINITY_DN8029_c0_g1_i1.p2 TRINITY_DN8029_c0_g1~~TRINITY_DN8029_c0_g1_i1.p2  ORF type:complete len:105 (-),score=38.73 TRINITY_DN8029_c0_g1_i1:64-378(-)